MSEDVRNRALMERSRNSSRNGFGRLKYNDTHENESGLMLTFKEYQYKRPDQGSIAQAIETGTEISLPIPYNLNVQYQTRWDNPGGGAFQEFVSHTGGSFLNNALNNTTEQNMSAFSALDIKMDSFKKAAEKGASALGTDMLAGTRMFQNAGMGAGIARNPFLASAFEGVQFRIFNFEYKLYPKSRKDSDMIRKIIDAFKYGMHPSYHAFGGMKNALFNYPYIYKPAFTKPNYLFDFGHCVITEFGPSYHAEGTPLYIDDDGEKIPAFISISMSLQEIEIVTKDNLTGPSGKTFGIGK